MMRRESLGHLYIGNLAFSATEEDVKKCVDAFAPVRDVRVPKAANGIAAGYGFAELHDVHDLDKVLARMDGVEIKGRPIRLALVKNKSGQGSAALQKKPETGEETRKKKPVFGIFVLNLPKQVKYVELKDLFREYECTRASIPRDRYTGKAKGYGFVHFKSAEQRDSALREMQNVLLYEQQLVLSPMKGKKQANLGYDADGHGGFFWSGNGAPSVAASDDENDGDGPETEILAS